jgi:hypothetical protein
MSPFKDGRNFEIRNNLVLAKMGPDLAVHASVHQTMPTWQVDHNWRQVKPASDQESGDWILPTNDKVVAAIELMSDDPQSADFLRPMKDSPLATGGGELAAYVGAVPPEGIEPWDCHKTWKLRAGKLEGLK